MVERYTREKMIDDAMLLWRKYAIEYRTLLDEYENDLMIKDALGIDLNKLGKKFLEEYPEIKYMDYNTERGARKYLEMLETYMILEQLRKAERFNKEIIVENLRKRNKKSKEDIRAYRDGLVEKKNYKKDAVAVSPKSCSSGRHTHRVKLSFTGGLNINHQ